MEAMEGGTRIPLIWDGPEEERLHMERLCPFLPFLQRQAQDPEGYLEAFGRLEWMPAKFTWHGYENRNESIEITIVDFAEADVTLEYDRALLQCGAIMDLRETNGTMPGWTQIQQGWDHAELSWQEPGVLESYDLAWREMLPEQRRIHGADFNGGSRTELLRLLPPGKLVRKLKWVLDYPPSDVMQEVARVLEPLEGVPVVEIQRERGDDLVCWVGSRNGMVMIVEARPWSD